MLNKMLIAFFAPSVSSVCGGSGGSSVISEASESSESSVSVASSVSSLGDGATSIANRFFKSCIGLKEIKSESIVKYYCIKQLSPLYKRSPPNHWPNIVQPSQLCICSRRAHVTYLSKAKTDLALPSQINIGSRRARSFQNLIKKGAYLSEVFDQEGCILFKTCLRRANTFQEGRVPFKI